MAKRVVLVLLLLGLVTSANAKVFLKKDKEAHMIGGAIIYGTCLVASKYIDSKYLTASTCALVTLGAAIGKEVYDKQHPDIHTSEFSDISATVFVPAMHLIFYKW